jgi:hypothetical protein
MTEVNFDDLINDILENPELILKKDLTAEQVLEIQKRLNPYAGIASAGESPERRRIAAVSYTNLREDYLRRFTATSLVGFIFQYLKEWDVPVEQRRWRKTETVTPTPFTTSELVDRLETILTVAKEANAANLNATELKRTAAELDLLNEDDTTKQDIADKYKLAEAEAARAAGLLYATTHAAHKLGIHATERLHATATEGMKYQEVRDVLSKQPLPPPANQFEIPADTAKNIIDHFLRNLFEFDPSIHTRAGAAKLKDSLEEARLTSATRAVSKASATTPTSDPADPSHLTIEEVRAAAPPPAQEHKHSLDIILEKRESYRAVVALLRDEDLLNAAITAFSNAEVFRKYLMPVPTGSAARPAIDILPPQDTFHRWNYYTEVNYEELRTITEAIYPEKSDLDWAIALWDVFEGTEAEVDAAFQKHCQRYQDEVPSSIKALDFGCWSLLADFKENRKKIQFYNKNTEVIKRILDRHAEDKRLGADLMRNRVRHAKAKNIAEEGPDAPGLAQYRRANAMAGKDIGSKGAERVISPEEMRRLEKAKGNIRAAQELEVLDQYQAVIDRITKDRETRALTDEETRDLAAAYERVERAKEMLAVPDDTVQIDVFTNNTETGQFGKTHFYTRAENDGDLAPPAAAAAGLPKYAPYAIDHIISSAKDNNNPPL